MEGVSMRGVHGFVLSNGVLGRGGATRSLCVCSIIIVSSLSFALFCLVLEMVVRTFSMCLTRE